MGLFHSLLFLCLIEIDQMICCIIQTANVICPPVTNPSIFLQILVNNKNILNIKTNMYYINGIIPKLNQIFLAIIVFACYIFIYFILFVKLFIVINCTLNIFTNRVLYNSIQYYPKIYSIVI